MDVFSWAFACCVAETGTPSLPCILLAVVPDGAVLVDNATVTISLLAAECCLF